MLLSWRGESYEVALDNTANSVLAGTHVAVWAPSCDPLLMSLGHRSDQWLADYRVGGTVVYLQAYGSSPQAALDALAAVVPAVPVSRGGAC